MERFNKIRNKYPIALKKCMPEALTYGRCVTTSIDLKANECEKEFLALNQCFQKAVKTLK